MLTIAQFAKRLSAFAFTRRINAVHCHHTWRPDRSMWRGKLTMDAMRAFHVEQQGWSAIAQHATIAPDGSIWVGDRSWNKAPASSGGHNGTAALGPFMNETVGNFDIGHDPLDGLQRLSVVAVTALVQTHFNLPVSSLRFHRHLNDGKKSCPGTGVDYMGLCNEVAAYRACADGTT